MANVSKTVGKTARALKTSGALVVSLAFTLCSAAGAETPQWFIDSTDVQFTMQYLKTRPVGKKNKRVNVALYKVLDVERLPSLPAQMLTDDTVQLVYPCNRKRKQIPAREPLPWAELKTDGIIDVHMPGKFLKHVETNDVKTIWEIENRSNRFKVLKPAKGRWLTTSVKGH